jgi:hypothetical protein
MKRTRSLGAFVGFPAGRKFNLELWNPGKVFSPFLSSNFKNHREFRPLPSQ